MNQERMGLVRRASLATAVVVGGLAVPACSSGGEASSQSLGEVTTTLAEAPEIGSTTTFSPDTTPSQTTVYVTPNETSPTEPPTSAPTSVPTVPNTSAQESQSSPDNCASPVDIPVFPGSRLKPSNADDINRQIDALASAYNDQKVTYRNVFNAMALITNAEIDPEYAAAMAKESAYLESQHNAGQPITPLSAEQLLAMNFDGPDCLTDQQISQVNDLFGTLVINLGQKADDQMSMAAKAAYSELKNKWEAYKQQYDLQ